MPVVHMKCPNCGATMVLSNNQFSCPNCRTMVLNIIDAKIDADVTVMSPEEFGKKIEESKRQFVVNINDNLKVFDVNTLVANKKIQDATIQLNEGNFDDVLNILQDLPNNILSVERLRFLAKFKVKNEYELSFYDGYIDKYKYSYGIGTNDHYAHIMELADEKTKNTYKKLAEHCREQHDIKKQIENEIKETKKLLDVKLYQEAIAYTKEMCKKYPHTALSWAYSCEVKCAISNNYNGNFEFAMMEKCPDYSEQNLPDSLQKKIKCCKELSEAFVKEYKEDTIFATRLAAFLWGATLLISCILATLATENNRQIDSNYISYISQSLLIPFWIGFLISLSHTKKKCKKKQKIYDEKLKLVPLTIQKSHKQNIDSKFIKARRFINSLLLIWRIIPLLITLVFLIFSDIQIMQPIQNYIVNLLSL